MSATATEATETTTWHVTGSYFEACNCDAICPCRQVGDTPGGRSTSGICQFALSWWVRDGYWGETRLDGLKVVMAGFYDDDEKRSPWRVSLYVDEAADDAQHAALADIFLGRAGGGTWANFARAITDVHNVRPARIDLQHDPGDWRIGVEGFIRVEAHEVVATESRVTCGIPGHDHPGQELVCTVLSVDDTPLNWEMQGKCGFATDFDYSG